MAGFSFLLFLNMDVELHRNEFTLGNENVMLEDISTTLKYV